MQRTWVKWFFSVILAMASIVVVIDYHATAIGLLCSESNPCVDVEISGTDMQFNQEAAANVNLLRELANKYSPDGGSFIATPLWPGAYALLERKSPMWDIYPLSHRSEAFEQLEIERIKVAKPGFALIFDYALDGDDKRRFKNTHPLIHQFILGNFEEIHESANPAYHIHKAK